jgi:hypothetical protein
MLHIGINALHGDAPSILFPRHCKIVIESTRIRLASKISTMPRKVRHLLNSN